MLRPSQNRTWSNDAFLSVCASAEARVWIRVGQGQRLAADDDRCNEKNGAKFKLHFNLFLNTVRDRQVIQLYT